MRRRICLALSVVLFSVTAVVCSESAQAAARRSLISLRIKMVKNVFHVDEPLEGLVILTNRAPAVLPAVFEIRIFHNAMLLTSIATGVPEVPQGVTNYSLSHFGIPKLTRGPEAIGTWRIAIRQLGSFPSPTIETAIRVVPAPKRELHASQVPAHDPNRKVHK